jgi:hypothetical protein
MINITIACGREGNVLFFKFMLIRVFILEFYLFIYLFLRHTSTVSYLMVTRILIISSIHMPIATALSGGSASGVVDWANFFRVVSSFHDSGIASSLR